MKVNNALTGKQISPPSTSRDTEIVKDRLLTIKQHIGSFSPDSRNFVLSAIKTIGNKLQNQEHPLIKELYACVGQRDLMIKNCKTKETVMVEIQRLQAKVEDIGKRIALLFEEPLESKKLDFLFKEPSESKKSGSCYFSIS